ncbi:tyrosine-type recombinase/integrase [Synechocystis sp. PCC 7509]|uniref:tyrosine-type recombinase/integrase n=1 Tax=Synechocystis sp. PCC 7509 TaxID=927677 RepID=UPI0009073306|nr:tyrosine-type recombinase/integrase [Synechocystis sp. PCC 7509]
MQHNHLRYDCLSQDTTGAYWIRVYQRKMKKEISLIISKELAELIHKQQKFITENLGIGRRYLFCDTRNRNDFIDYKNKHKYSQQPLLPLNHFEAWEKKLQDRTVRAYLHRFADEMNIRDEAGEIFPLGQLHQFRHTHGTELINNGVPQYIVQKRLGHESPGMTSVYAHIHDQTMKAEMEKFWDGKVVNNKGEIVVPENPDLDTAEMQWIKKNMKAQTLADGFCGLPVTKSCPAQDDPCSNCSFFRTTRQDIETHRKRLEATEKLIENARKNGWERQVEKNLPIAENLKKIIRGLEQKGVIYGNEKFPEQQLDQGGEQSA